MALVACLATERVRTSVRIQTSTVREAVSVVGSIVARNRLWSLAEYSSLGDRGGRTVVRIVGPSRFK